MSPAEATVEHVKPQRQLLTRPIVDIQPGDRVLAKNPLRHGSHDDFAPVDPKTWKQVQLQVRKDHGGEVKVTLLRPLQWL